MIFENRNNLFIGRFSKLFNHPHIVHGFSTRVGGVSQVPYDTLNLGHHTTDRKPYIKKNQNRFFQSLQIPTTQLAVPQQVHSAHILKIDSPGYYDETDGLLTNKKSIGLIIQVADCVPIYLYDPEHHVIGLVHAGWRGTTRQISSKAIKMMKQIFESNPLNVLAFIGPSIGPCCYKVGPEVATQFPDVYISNHYLDLWAYNKQQILDQGIPIKNLEVSQLCTACHSRWFFSYRKSGGRTGRMMAVLGLL